MKMIDSLRIIKIIVSVTPGGYSQIITTLSFHQGMVSDRGTLYEVKACIFPIPLFPKLKFATSVRATENCIDSSRCGTNCYQK